MTREDVPDVVRLQRLCFPEPFPAELLWQPEHLLRHLEVFSEGQFVADAAGTLIGSASSLIVSEENWQRHADWEATCGGFFFHAHDPTGTTLFGADISVHPIWRRKGVGKAFYQARFDLAERLGLRRFGTACRIPGWSEWTAAHPGRSKTDYCLAVARGEAFDRTLTPLLRSGLRFVRVIEGHMRDEESGDAAAVLELRAEDFPGGRT